MDLKVVIKTHNETLPFVDPFIIISVRYASPGVNINANSGQKQPLVSQTEIYFTVNTRKRVFKAQF